MQNALKKEKIQKGILTAAVILLVVSLVLVILMSTGTYAKYKTEGSGSDNARVASFNVNAEAGEETDLSILLDEDDGQNDTADYHVTLTNNSEVAARCAITVDITDNAVDEYGLGEGGNLQISLYGTSNGAKDYNKVVSGVVSADGTSITFTDAAVFETGESTQEVFIEFKYPDSEEIERVEGAYTFTVSADFEQID